MDTKCTKSFKRTLGTLETLKAWQLEHKKAKGRIKMTINFVDKNIVECSAKKNKIKVIKKVKFWFWSARNSFFVRIVCAKSYCDWDIYAMKFLKKFMYAKLPLTLILNLLKSTQRSCNLFLDLTNIYFESWKFLT